MREGDRPDAFRVMSLLHVFPVIGECDLERVVVVDRGLERTAQGVVAFRLVEQEPDIIRLEVEHFTAATDDAYAGLWKFLLEHDLVTGIRARHRSIDEPLPLLLADRRAVRWGEVEDFLWVRVLDPIATLESRRYGSAGRLDLEITDAEAWAEYRRIAGPLMIAAGGRFIIRSERIETLERELANLREEFNLFRQSVEEFKKQFE